MSESTIAASPTVPETPGRTDLARCPWPHADGRADIQAASAAAVATLLDLSLSHAAALLDACGSLAGLRQVGPAHRRRVGVTPRQEHLLTAAFALVDAIHAERPVVGTRVTRPRDVAAFLLPEMAPLEREQFRVLVLDTTNHVQVALVLYEGTLSSVEIRVADVFAPAIRHNAAAIIVAHNHPSGEPTPAENDSALTATFVRAGALLDIEVLDHLIIATGGVTSLREHGFGW